MVKVFEYVVKPYFSTSVKRLDRMLSNLRSKLKAWSKAIAMIFYFLNRQRALKLILEKREDRII
jgi:hypothetical protein